MMAVLPVTCHGSVNVSYGAREVCIVRYAIGPERIQLLKETPEQAPLMILHPVDALVCISLPREATGQLPLSRLGVKPADDKGASQKDILLRHDVEQRALWTFQ